jgi:putative ATP-dependent endonuclease of the OLD family
MRREASDAHATEDLDLAYELVRPDGTTDNLSVPLRRSMGLVRLSGDDRTDRDLRLVQGSALDRLLSDKGLRSRVARELAKSDLKDDSGSKSAKSLVWVKPTATCCLILTR